VIGSTAVWHTKLNLTAAQNSNPIPGPTKCFDGASTRILASLCCLQHVLLLLLLLLQQQVSAHLDPYKHICQPTLTPTSTSVAPRCSLVDPSACAMMFASIPSGL
jgi:hypothetical protein